MSWRVYFFKPAPAGSLETGIEELQQIEVEDNYVATAVRDLLAYHRYAAWKEEVTAHASSS